MLATRCSFCNHENIPGTRFCADCGSPMHLKVCSDPQCGKVSAVSAEVCESCGKPFPKVEVVPTGTTHTEAPREGQQRASKPATAGKDKPRSAVWPLLIVAIVAGGLPLLWANRTLLPKPKAWQIGTPEAPRTGGANSAPVVRTPPPTSSTPTPAVATSAPGQAVAPGEVAPGTQGPTANASEGTGQNRALQPAAEESPKKVAKASRTKKKEPPRPCTEAMAALGLCNLKPAEK